jgi:hypothetical protein
MSNAYIPPCKRNKNRNSENKTIKNEFPSLNTSTPISNKNIGAWNNKINFSKINSNNNSSDKFIDKTNLEKQNEFFIEQKKTQDNLMALTLEQSERDKLNVELKDESPFWGIKSLLEPESDISDDEYDVNKDDETEQLNNIDD